MSELSDWKRICLPSELAEAHARGKAEGIAEAQMSHPERQRQEDCEADRRELLMMLAGRPDITRLFGFKEKAVFEAARQHANGAPPSTTEAENE